MVTDGKMFIEDKAKVTISAGKKSASNCMIPIWRNNAVLEAFSVERFAATQFRGEICCGIV